MAGVKGRSGRKSIGEEFQRARLMRALLTKAEGRLKENQEKMVNEMILRLLPRLLPQKIEVDKPMLILGNDETTGESEVSEPIELHGETEGSEQGG